LSSFGDMLRCLRAATIAVAEAGMLVRTPRELGAFVRDARTQRRLTQAELAKQVGVSRSWVIDLEAGKRTLEIGLVLLVLETLEIRLELSRVVSLTGRASAKASTYATLEVAPVDAILGRVEPKVEPKE
jgi:y4mF family transcriptional regulator